METLSGRIINGFLEHEELLQNNKEDTQPQT